MKLNNHYSDEELEEKSEEIEENFENLEEGSEKQGRLNLGKIIGFLGMLKLQGLKIIYFLIDILNLGTNNISKLSNMRLANFIKEKWHDEMDMPYIYSIYRNYTIDNINDVIMRYYKLNKDIHNNTERYNEINSEIKQKTVSNENLGREKHELEQKILEMKKERENIPRWLTDMSYLRKSNLVPELKSERHKDFIKECINDDSKIKIIYNTIILISLLYFILRWREYNILGTGIGLGMITWAYYKVLCFFEYRKVRKYIYNNTDLLNEIRDYYIKALEIVKSYGKNMKDETPKISIKQPSTVTEPSTAPQPSIVQQQPKQEEIYDNPYADMWKEINRKYFKLDDFRIPEYEKLELIERHIIHDYDLKEEDVVKISENIEKYRGVPINSIKSIDGKIIVDFLIGEFPNLIPFSEVPKVDENFIVAGKSAEGWITWNLDRQPHGLIVGTTGSGKSNTVRFVFNEFQKKKNYLMYVIDFKGGSDYYFLDGKYKLITDTEGFIDFIKKLDSELTYRQKLFKDLRSNEIDEINNILKKKGENTIPHLKVFMDEFAFVSSLPKEIKNSVIKAIEQLMQRGRSFGMHFTFIVQKPTAENLGSSYIRSLIGFRLIGKLEEEADYEKSFGASNNLKGQDKVFADKMKNEADFLGKFVVKGGYIENNPLGRNIVVRIPFMDVSDYDKMVLNEWEDNPYADYKLHYSEEDFEDEGDEVLNKMYGKGKDNAVEVPYEVIEEVEEVEVVEVDEDNSIQDYFDNLL